MRNPNRLRRIDNLLRRCDPTVAEVCEMKSEMVCQEKCKISVLSVPPVTGSVQVERSARRRRR